MTRRVRLSRKLVGALGWAAAGLCFAGLAFGLLDIIWMVLRKGGASIEPSTFTTSTNGVSGGLWNAIEGTLVLTLGSVLFAGPIGMLVGIYLSEYAGRNFAKVVRYLSDVLVGVPSIVLGLFGYITMVLLLGWHFSVLAGAITLSIMITPYIARTTEIALRQVPVSYRESAYALGANDVSVIFKVVVPACGRRILTGVLLALAISMGETAPLIYTVDWSNYPWNGKLTNEPMGYLTYVIWSFINEPFESAHKLAFAAALLVTVFALTITLVARLVLSRFRRLD